MFDLAHAGFYYGPFESADAAAAAALEWRIGGPWQIIRLRPILTEAEKAAIRERFEAGAR
jgi:hypothetical protein